MPQASNAGKAFYHAVAIQAIKLNPPTLNAWVTVLEYYGRGRLLYCTMFQDNVENAAKNIEFKWLRDLIAETGATSLPSGAVASIFLDPLLLNGTPASLNQMNGRLTVGYTSDIRFYSHIKLEIRITSALGTNQRLWSEAVYEPYY